MLRFDIIPVIWVLRIPYLLIKVEQILDLYFEPFNIYLNIM